MAENENSQRRGERVQTLEEGYNLSILLTSRLEKAVSLTGNDIGLLRVGLRQGVGKLVGAVTQFASDVVKLNRESLKFNRTYNESVNKAGQDIKGLPGGIRQSLTSLFAFQSAGLMNASKESLGLANKMGITGQNVGALVKLQKKLITQGLLSSRGQAAFAKNLDTFSMRYGVSTEHLINSLESLGDSVNIFGLTGSQATTTAITELGAMFPAFGKDISKFVDMLMNADFGQLAKLGIDDDVLKLFTGGGATAGDLLSIISQTKKGQSRFGDFKSAGSFPELQHLMTQGGAIGMLGSTLAEGIANAAPTAAQEEGNKLMTDLTTALKMVFEPMAKVAGTFIVPFLSAMGKFIGFLEKIHLVSGLLLAKIAVQIGATIKNTAALIRNSLHKMGGGTMSPAFGAGVATRVGTASMGAMMGGMATMLWPILVGAGLIALIGALSESTAKLATAEETRARAELRRIEDEDVGLSRFEAVTRSLISDFIQTQSMADSIAFQSIAEQKRQTEELAAVIERGNDNVVAAIGEDKGPTFV